MQAKRIKWKEQNLKGQHNNLVFLDESSVNIDMIRKYGRAVWKTRVHCSTPLTQIILASVRLNNQITRTMYSGGTTGTRFLDYLKNVPITTLQQGDIVVMDNMQSYHVKGVEETLRSSPVLAV